MKPYTVNTNSKGSWVLCNRCGSGIFGFRSAAAAETRAKKHAQEEHGWIEETE